MDNYEILNRSYGEGAFGVVMKGKNKTTGEIVALKKIRIKKQELNTFPKKALEELKALQMCSHKNVLGLLDYFPLGSSIVLVMEFCETDLSTILKSNEFQLSEAHIKCYLKQLLEGLAYMHSKNLLHRDIKPANLLINKEGILKIGDFGLATLYLGSDKKYSHQVASRWYRAPELLYGSQTYSFSVDLFATGLVFGEMINNAPLIIGESDIDQLTKVIKTFGNPEDEWKGIKELPDFNKINFPKFKKIKTKDLLPNASELAIDLFEKLVRYDPKARITAKEALLHGYFFSKPYPVDPKKLKLFYPKIKLKDTTFNFDIFD